MVPRIIKISFSYSSFSSFFHPLQLCLLSCFTTATFPTTNTTILITKNMYKHNRKLSFFPHDATPHSVGFLWTSDQLDTRPVPDNTQHLQEITIHAPSGIRTRNPRLGAAAIPRLRPHGHCDQRKTAVNPHNLPLKPNDHSMAVYVKGYAPSFFN